MATVTVIGARRARQGTGEFIARWFADAGAHVVAVVGRSPDTAAEAATALRDRYGIECRSYSDPRAALDQEQPDIVAIATPYEHHRELLDLVAETGADCLCEKPLWWGDAPDRRAETERLVGEFAMRGAYLGLVTQWPQTLPAFYQLHPDARDEPFSRFEMRMCPMFPGPSMILDAVPHVVSMLQAIGGAGRAGNPVAQFADPKQRCLVLGFAWRHAGGTAKVQCSFTVLEKPPRPAAYAVNGRRVDREIELPEYRMFMKSRAERIAIEDPLKLLIREFLANAGYPDPAGARTGTPVAIDREALVEGIATLELLTRAAGA